MLFGVVLPVSMESLGAGSTMLMAAVVAAAGAGLSQWLAPETKGMSSPRRLPCTRTDQAADRRRK